MTAESPNIFALVLDKVRALGMSAIDNFFMGNPMRHIPTRHAKYFDGIREVVLEDQQFRA